MLIAVGGLMASIVLPAHAGSTLALTVTAAAAKSIHRAIKNRKQARQHPDQSTTHTAVSSAPSEVILQWQNVSCHLEVPKASPRPLLQHCSGIARPGRVLAILGPSGSGKTTLLNALAGRLPKSKALQLFGSITANGRDIDSDFPIAYLTQEDLFFSQLSVQETLEIAARLGLSSNSSSAQRQQLVEDLIRKLGLVSVTKTRVGDNKTRGISGGEKKRLSLACELISTPRLILCDEPTSGLDAFQAEKVMDTLKQLAEQGHTVVCSIHQPSSTIFQICDDLVLLASGRVVYSGTASDAPEYFKESGFPVPAQCNPAERYLELISVDYSSNETITQSEKRINKLVQGFKNSKHNQNGTIATTQQNANGSMPETTQGTLVKRVGLIGQVRVLLSRAWKQIIRDKKTNISRFMSSLMSALLFGAIYWRIGRTQSTIQDRLGLLQVCCINSAMTSLVKTLNVFPQESVLVNRERARGSYNILQYFCSKLIAEMPVSAFFPLIFSMVVYPMVGLSGGVARILRFMGIITLESFTAASYGLAVGALVSSTEAALAVGPSSFVLQIVFGGLYITDKSVPVWARWIPKISLIKHAYEGLCVNEFRGMEFQTRRPWDVKTGDQVLERMTWGESTVAQTCISQSRVLVFNYLLTYAILILKKPQFTQLQPVNEEVVDDAKVPQPVDEEPALKQS